MTTITNEPATSNVITAFKNLVRHLQDEKKTLIISTKSRANIKDFRNFESVSGLSFCRSSSGIYNFISEELPLEYRNTLSDTGGTITYTMPAVSNFPKPASLVRRCLIKAKANNMEFVERCAVRNSDIDLPCKMAHEIIHQFMAKINGKKYSLLDKYLAEYVSVTNGVQLKAHISSVWPKYRGMFGDHMSCYYPTREYGYCSGAIEQYGWIIRFYDMSVSDEAIYANPDNPLGVAKPLDNMPDEDGNTPFAKDEIKNTDGCIGRCLVVPNNHPVHTLSVINAYCHTKKSVSIIRNDVADFLVDAINNFQHPETDPGQIPMMYKVMTHHDCRVAEEAGLYINNSRSSLLLMESNNQGTWGPATASDYRIRITRIIQRYLDGLRHERPDDANDPEF